METSQKGSHRPKLATYKPHGWHTSSSFPFERLPLEIRLRIYDRSLPESIIFQGSQRERRSHWPNNPLAALAVCYSQFQNEINFRLYSATRFIFYDSLYNRHDRSVRTYGYEIAARFFSRIGPMNLSYIKKIHCHFHWTSSCANSPDFSNMLSLMALADPPRKISRLHLSFTKTSHVKPFEDAPVVRRPCFVLHGFPGLKFTLIFPNSKDRISVADLNAMIAIFRDPGPPVNFLTILPAELRTEIFRYLVPSVCSHIPAQRKRIHNTPGWMSVNRQMSTEICSVMYRECQFEFCVPSSQIENPHRKEDSRFVSFLKRIGRKNARQIRSVTIVLDICLGPWIGRTYIPSIAGIRHALNNSCDFQIGTYSILGSLPERVPHRYQFRIPTRAGRTLIVEIRLRWLSHFPLYSVNSVDRWAPTVLARSLGGIRSSIRWWIPVFCPCVKKNPEAKLALYRIRSHRRLRPLSDEWLNGRASVFMQFIVNEGASRFMAGTN